MFTQCLHTPLVQSANGMGMQSKANLSSHRAHLLPHLLADYRPKNGVSPREGMNWLPEIHQEELGEQVMAFPLAKMAGV